MNIPDPSVYFGKKLKVYSSDGAITTGKFDGYSYDYDDDGNEFLDFAIRTENGFLAGYAENEVERIEVIGDI